MSEWAWTACLILVAWAGPTSPMAPGRADDSKADFPGRFQARPLPLLAQQFPVPMPDGGWGSYRVVSQPSAETAPRLGLSRNGTIRPFPALATGYRLSLSPGLDPNTQPFVTLDLDLRPDDLLLHPLGCLVLAQGHLFHFQKTGSGPEWNRKDLLLSPADPGMQAPLGFLHRAPDGGVWIVLSSVSATAWAPPGGKPLEIPRGESLWKILPGLPGGSIQCQSFGATRFGSLLFDEEGHPWLRQISTGPDKAKSIAYKRWFPGAWPQPSPEKKNHPDTPGDGLPGAWQDRWLISRRKSASEERQLWVIEAQPESQRIVAQRLDADGPLHRPDGEPQLMVGDLPRGKIALGAQGQLLLGTLETKPSGGVPQLQIKGEVASPPLADGSPTPGPKGQALTPLGPVPLAAMVVQPDRVIAWAGWAEAARRILLARARENAGPLPVVKELIKLASNEESDDSARLRVISLLEMATDPESKNALIELAENASPGVRMRALEALAQRSTPADGQVYQVFLNGMSDAEPGIKAISALGLGRVDFPGSANALATALSFEGDLEGAWANTLRYGLRLLGKSGHKRVLELAQSGNESDLERAVGHFAQTKDTEATQPILQLLGSPHLTGNQPTRLLESLTIQGSAAEGEALLRLGKAHPDWGAAEHRLIWQALQTTPIHETAAAADWLLDLLRDKREDLRWLALGKLNRQRYSGMAGRLEKERESFPLSPAQKESLVQAIQYQKISQGSDR